MFNEAKTFLADSDRDLSPATWTLPSGETVLVESGQDGYHLYTAEEWNNALVSSYAADRDGRVRLHGAYVDPDNPAWVVPARVRVSAKALA